jgi:hypothetical protein
MADVLAEAVVEALTHLREVARSEQAEVRVIFEWSRDGCTFCSRKPSEGPLGEAPHTADVAPVVRSQGIEGLSQALVGSFRDQRLDQAHGLLQAAHLTWVGYAVEHWPSKEEVTEVSYDTDSGGGNDALSLRQQLATLFVTRISIEAPGEAVDAGVERDRAVAESREETDQAPRTGAEHPLQNGSG